MKNDYLDQAFGLGTRGAGDGRGAGTGVRHRSGAGPGRGESGRQRPVRAGLRRGLRTLERGGHPARGAPFDVADGEAVAAALRELEAAGWAPDVLVSNAGNQNRKPVVEMTPAEWQALQNVHVNGAFNCARAALPGMVRRGFGRIVLMSSVAGQATMPNIAAYATAKGAIAAFARALAVEYGGSGITCNALAPGFVRTDFTQGLQDNPQFQSFLSTAVPAGRWAEPDDIAPAVVYLAAPGAAFVNGQVLAIDGGLLARM